MVRSYDSCNMAQKRFGVMIGSVPRIIARSTLAVMVMVGSANVIPCAAEYSESDVGVERSNKRQRLNDDLPEASYRRGGANKFFQIVKSSDSPGSFFFRTGTSDQEWSTCVAAGNATGATSVAAAGEVVAADSLLPKESHLSTRETLERIIGLSRPEVKLIGLSAATLGLTSSVTLLLPYLSGQVIDAALLATQNPKRPRSIPFQLH